MNINNFTASVGYQLNNVNQYV